MQNDKRDLLERTKQFALSVIRMFSIIPKMTEAQILGKQLPRLGTSVGANYREAYRGRSKAEFIAKCGDSLRELEETAYWLELLVDGKMIPPERLAAVQRESDELLAIFVTILKRSKDNSYFLLSVVFFHTTSSLFLLSISASTLLLES
jgi:four helix bundle protein